MLRTAMSSWTICVLLATAAPAGEASPKFTVKPTAKRVNGKVKISFTVSAPTDVEVAILDAGGKVVRHLVAGVLGKNPPPPLKAGLSQSLEWDGEADYGKNAGPGPFKVRVALGLGAKYDKVLLEDPHSLSGIYSIAVGPPDGTLYVVQKCDGAANYDGSNMIAFNRDGSYQRMIMPFPCSLPYERAQGFDAVTLEGRTVPVAHYFRYHNLYPVFMRGRGVGMAVTSKGVILRPGGGYQNRHGETACITALKTDGGCAWGRYEGPALLSDPRAGYTPKTGAGLCLSSTEEWAYLSGVNSSWGEAHPVVYRVKLPERTPCAPFFGDPKKKGAGKELLGSSVRGLALDGKGHLLIADTLNNRVVVVSEQNGKYVGEMKVVRPDRLAFDRDAGLLYLTRLVGNAGAVELVKYAFAKGSGAGFWKSAKEVSRLHLKGQGNPAFPWQLALDSAARPPVLWMASESGSLLRIEDQSAKFGDPELVSNEKLGNGSFVDLVVDRFRKDKEVYARCFAAGAGYSWFRYGEATDKFEKVRLPVGRASGSCIVPGPGGLLYTQAYPWHMLRFTRDAKPAPWPAGNAGYPEKFPNKNGGISLMKSPNAGGSVSGVPQGEKPAHGVYVPTSMTFMTHTLGVRHDGHIFALEPAHPGNRPPKMLREYLPNGKLARAAPIIWLMSDYAVGPKFDQQGNMYFAEIIRPLDDLYPKVFAERIGKVDLNGKYQGSLTGHNLLGMYGSIIKFSPRGGMIHYTDRHNGTDLPFKAIGKPKLPDGLKKTKAAWYAYSQEGGAHPRKWYTVDVSGAEWMRMGISHVEHAKCNCESVRFDVDEFGRVWYPDMGRYRVAVLDTNGNSITHFGGYGNAESKGPDSPVVDPKSGKVRPRKPGEKLKSPFAEPGIAFSWLVGVGVTDRYAYMGDSLNRRMLRARLTYAAEETCGIK